MSYVSKTQMRKVVISGTIGSGKTYISNILKERGVPVLCLDEVAAHIRDTQAKADIIEAFGQDILTNDEIDRKKLGNIVFASKQAKRQLESFIHPKVLVEMQAFFKKHTQAPICVVEVANVHEFGWEVYFDEVWIVTCDDAVAIERLMKQRGYSKEYANTVLNAQKKFMPTAQQVSAYIYNNPGDDVVSQLDTLLESRGSYDIT
ncbi:MULTISPECIES: dephospho-CoA kinase [unclassified Breznakia]|uniref:dephospho-CoA kinase n=1 Tax=unclassified Breznakia TaxID=2623764 RepID=UPI002476B320|nr:MULTISPECIES: dephospho-CoA kinase [unclassified Breznakia]MDH6366443.1 dephospho-CoA kinase [Breznakia sp. PH1-1]MDH6403536.1 dephospho-CoA kinase [Breznakia sp. PF1-11]MDH6411245.1 dephospho-CoA kinase [Breznakia sp. PFB1-11]MDH6413492.1 dephospho-CoA kinase [Breznakia sp. PFB1-14]MDH6415790.1 dephospho-CoA kinase [Breznakia sp. PFB1-4]